MGGGGAMRVASKFSGFVINGGLRGAPSVHIADQSVTSAARKSSRPVATVVSSSVNEDGKSSVFFSSQNGKIEATASVHRPSWDLDDWEFAGDEEELFSDSVNPIPRVVFGGVPTAEEAEEATSELKDALEKVFFSSSNPTGCGSVFTVQESTLSIPSDSGFLETKACVASETALAPALPQPVFQAFRLLKESPEAQSVVASLASDKSVWNAVMQNEKVMEFFQSQKTNAHSHVGDIDVNESFADNAFQNQESSKNIEDMSDVKHSESSGEGFMGFLQNIKLTIVEMMSNLSGFFQNIFGVPAAENKSGDANSSSTTTYVDSVMEASFMALAVLAIMVVVLKRG